MSFRIISAGAGSGKTYRLTSEMVDLLRSKTVRPQGIIATTFTKKAAAELQERVRTRLLEEGETDAADQLSNALIGTVHGLGVKLLQRFAYEAGVSPQVAIMAEEDQQLMFNQALTTVLTGERVEKMETLSNTLGLYKRERNDWRQEVKTISDIARANGFEEEVLETSKNRSVETLLEYLEAPIKRSPKAWNDQLQAFLKDTIDTLRNGEDGTKKTATACNTLIGMRNELQVRGQLFWHQWVKIGKLDVGTKSRDAVAPLKEFAATHESNIAFQEDIRQFIYGVFETAQAALAEYANYKRRRGLIDYIDMEVLINRLLDHPHIQEVLSEELDLLMVDEFQDTSPIQLEIFLKLSRLAEYSIWVGDPKQSIYGFRGADPALMQAIIQKNGGIRPEDIQEYSWRSREDIVYATNALFTKAFTNIPKEQVALKPKRLAEAGPNTLNKTDEPSEMGRALIHWHFVAEGNPSRSPGSPWMENSIAQSVRTMLEREKLVLPKGESDYRPCRPGDIAILCRTNHHCQAMAESLSRAGLKAAISRAGLLKTAEARLILACLKFILNRSDTLSVAEVLLLASGNHLKEIIENRLDYLDELGEKERDINWAKENPFIRQLNTLREEVIELSSTEILNLVLEELDLRRIIFSWGNVRQRLSNVEMLTKFALQYEEGCHRLHTAASLGGFLLWLNDLGRRDIDWQGSGEAPDTVNVLTYHKSKGLEYPVVICHQLEGTLRGDVWGVKIIQETEEIDLNHVLGNRWLRYWVNPYSDQIKKTALDDRIKASPAFASAQRGALEEEARLLYVGMTRARDFLVFPSRSRKDTKWLNRVWHRGEETFPTLSPDSSESPWDWEGRYLDVDTESFIYPRDFPISDLPGEELVYWEDRVGRRQQEPFLIDLRMEAIKETPDFQAHHLGSYGNGLEQIEDNGQAYQLAKAFKALLASDYDDYDQGLREKMMMDLLQRFEPDDTYDPSVFLDQADRFRRFIQQQYQPEKEPFRKFPLRYQYGMRRFETVVDFIWPLNEGVLLVQNSGFTGDVKQLDRKAGELADWFFLSQMGLSKVLGVKEVKLLLHFVWSGRMVEIQFENPQLSMF
jgi:ATP-dependent helicase/nuclease subunit A